MAAEGDPLFDTLFRSTVALAEAEAEAEAEAGASAARPSRGNEPVRRAEAHDRAASAAPQVNRGAHTRAGNAMDRTRSALLDGARLGVVRHGTKVSMAAIATLAGVAKATLYNHFRTRDAVLSALLVDEVSRLEHVARSRFGPDAEGLAAALTDVAHSIVANPVRAALAQSDPATLARVANIEPITGTSALWDEVRRLLTQLIADSSISAEPLGDGVDTRGVGRIAAVTPLNESGDIGTVPAVPASSTELVLRWLTSFLLSPAPMDDPASLSPTSSSPDRPPLGSLGAPPSDLAPAASTASLTQRPTTSQEPGLAGSGQGSRNPDRSDLGSLRASGSAGVSSGPPDFTSSDGDPAVFIDTISTQARLLALMVTSRTA